MLAVTLAVAAHGYCQFFRKGVNAGNAYAVQTARYLVAGIVKLAAGMQLGHDHLNSRHAFLGMNIHRNAAAIVAHGNAVVSVQNDGNPRTVASHGFVNGVVHHFVNKVVQATRVRGANVHGRALAHGREPFQNGNGRGVVAAVTGGLGSH